MKLTLLHNLRIAQKLALVVVSLVLASVISTVIIVQDRNDVIAFSVAERVGAAYIVPVQALAMQIARHRGLSGALLSGDNTAEAALKALEAEIEATFSKLGEQEKLSSGSLKTAEALGTLAGNWKKLLGEYRNLNFATSFERHTAVVSNAMALLSVAVDNSNLSLDPDMDSYYVMDIVTSRIPTIVEGLGQARGRSMEVAGSKALTSEQRNELVEQLTRAKVGIEGLQAAVDKVASANASLKEKSSVLSAQAIKSLQQAEETIEKQVLRATILAYTPKSLFDRVTPGINGVAELYGTFNPALDELLAKRIAKMERSRNMTVAMVLLFTLISVGLAVAISLALVRQINRAKDVAGAIQQGDLSSNVVATSTDEAGQLMTSLGGMQATLNQFLAAQLEMGQKHEAGIISHRIPVDQFQGAYAQAARQTNELAQGHIDTKMKVIEIAGQYAVGNLAADMPVMPGEKVVLTNAMVEMKSNLSAINAEILKLAAAAKHGDFTVRGDPERFDHDFKAMVNGLNDLMGTCQAGMGEIAQVLAALARGDLTHRAAEGYEGTFGEVIGNSVRTSDGLAEIINKIKEASQTINIGAQEIAAGNMNLSQRTEQQASSLQETASSMEELTQTVKQNAENSKQANQLAIGASQVAVKGGEMVAQVVGTMASINESSKKIVDIISVIDGIAFQTNILALNAAVEAARAGEQGRGFAVVASEVRNLAQRSASAAKEIKSLIGDSVDKVQTGTKLVEAAGATMGEIVTSVKRVSDIIAEITAASQEQASGIEQVGQAVTQMDQVTQQNAALVEESAAAAESMRDQAAAMAQTVGVFVVDGSAALPPSGTSLKPAPTNGSGSKVQFAGRPASVARPTSASARAASPKAPAMSTSEDEWEEF